MVALAAAALTGLPADELPVPLRRVAKFAPNRRARLGGPVIAAQLAGDPLFRQRVAARVLADAGDLGAAVRRGHRAGRRRPGRGGRPGLPGPPGGWRELVDAGGRGGPRRRRQRGRRRAAPRRPSTGPPGPSTTGRWPGSRRRSSATSWPGLRPRLGQLREESAALGPALRETAGPGRQAPRLLATEKGRATRAAADTDAELRRLRARLAEAEAAASGARSRAKDARSVDDARLWLLLETIGQAAVGLRRELALDPADKLPADFVADAFTDAPARPARAGRPRPGRRRPGPPRPAARPAPGAPGRRRLQRHQARLRRDVAGAAAQPAGHRARRARRADRCRGDRGLRRGRADARPARPPRAGVRVLFCRKGETADELIRRLVRAEPPGRPVVVVSSDREVADGVRRHGAYPLGADSLLRRLARS